MDPMIPSTTPTDNQLATLAQRIIETAAELEAAKAARDQAIIAGSQAGLTRRRVAALAGISHQRVQQIIDGH